MTRTAPPEADPTPQEPAPAAALHAGTSDLRALITRNLRTSGIYVAFVVIVALFAILTDGVSLSPGNITNIVLQYSYILVLAIGMVIVIIAGHIDLSVGSVVALTGAVSAVVVIRHEPAEDQPELASVLRKCRRYLRSHTTYPSKQLNIALTLPPGSPSKNWLAASVVCRPGGYNAGIPRRAST